ncbi:uncharacterized protein Dyak_GE27566 [Drosophila yakuba]|uniref:Uncharacterized protein n=1 Tax=Drosophila yakuba TaxID=7245 RepID=A0A0R1DSS6_DROYA|nr:uncharacterized protein Dyak_GE27566 [Drosophila yakuba]
MKVSYQEVTFSNAVNEFVFIKEKRKRQLCRLAIMWNYSFSSRPGFQLQSSSAVARLWSSSLWLKLAQLKAQRASATRMKMCGCCQVYAGWRKSWRVDNAAQFAKLH